VSYLKLDTGLLSSSLWIQGDAETVRVWIYLLLVADGRGIVDETVPAIAQRCKISVKRLTAILETFARPDRFSRTPKARGRRIIVRRAPQWSIEIVNFLLYRRKDHGAVARMKRYRDRQRALRVTPRNVTQGRGQRANAEGRETRTDGTARPARSLPMTDGTAQGIEALARDLEAVVPEVTAREWVVRASTIPADDHRPARSFEDPRKRGLSESWGQATLTRLRDLHENQRRPVPL